MCFVVKKPCFVAKLDHKCCKIKKTEAIKDICCNSKLEAPSIKNRRGKIIFLSADWEK